MRSNLLLSSPVWSKSKRSTQPITNNSSRFDPSGDLNGPSIPAKELQRLTKNDGVYPLTDSLLLILLIIPVHQCFLGEDSISARDFSGNANDYPICRSANRRRRCHLWQIAFEFDVLSDLCSRRDTGLAERRRQRTMDGKRPN